MSIHEFRFRDSDEEATFQLRELLRGKRPGLPMPSGRDGFVVENFDLVLRWFGPNFGLDARGRIRLVEVKREGSSLDKSQHYTFGLLAAALDGWPRFDGLHLVRHSNDVHDHTTRYTVGAGTNAIRMNAPDFLVWCLTPWSYVPAIDVTRWQEQSGRRAQGL